MAEVKKTVTESKKFAYAKGKVSLSFTLELSDKQSLKDFVELMTAGLEDVQAEIEK